MSDIDELLNRLDGGCSGAMYTTLTAATIRQLQADNERLEGAYGIAIRFLADSRAANASEFKRGQEVMREAAAKYMEHAEGFLDGGEVFSVKIRNLPIGE